MDEPADKCDFCGALKPTWQYPCESFRRDVEQFDNGVATGLLDQGFDGAWASCNDCHDAYEEGGVDRLVDRVAGQYVKRFPAITSAGPQAVQRLRSELRRLYRQFELHRVGDPVEKRYER